LMAAAAEKCADRIVITSDNPRGEDPAQIIETIRAGLTQPESVQVEPDRARAIAGTISQAGSDDTILIAGKGHESYQEIAGERYPFSDSQVAQACLRDRR